MPQYYEIYPGGAQSGEIVIETDIAADAFGCVLMSERDYESAWSAVGRERRGAGNYHCGYDVVNNSHVGGAVVLFPRSMRFNDPHIAHLLNIGRNLPRCAVDDEEAIGNCY